MLIHNTPVEDHRAQYGLLVKREDLSCPPPGPPFSKTRGVFAHVQGRPEQTIGVLDTYHSQAGHAVAAACALLGKRCVNFYPRYKADEGQPLRPQQSEAIALGAEVRALKAGRSAILYHQARRELAEDFPDSYLMPNALKLPEMVTETADEVLSTFENFSFKGGRELPSNILIAVSSATIAAGVIKGVYASSLQFFPYLKPNFILHMGYDRSEEALLKYARQQAGTAGDWANVILVNEGYQYKDKSKQILDLPFPANHYYDMKAVSWWMREGRAQYGEALLWLIG